MATDTAAFLWRYAELEASLDEEGRTPSWQRLAAARARLAACLDQQHERLFGLGAPQLATMETVKALQMAAGHVAAAFAELGDAMDAALSSVQRMRANITPYVADAIEILSTRDAHQPLLPAGTTTVQVQLANPALGLDAGGLAMTML